MAAAAISTMGRRIFVGDARDNGGFLRVTWHGEVGQFVVSNWEGNLCVGATRIRLEDAPEVIGVLAKGLADAGTRAAAPSPTSDRPARLPDLLRGWWRSRRRHGRAEVLPLRRG